jgi:hypothetical protein
LLGNLFYVRFFSGSSEAIMADLDNFFAKKDRKKTKGQKFATSSDNMATGQEELQKKQDKQKKERSERSLTIQNNYATENDNKTSKMVIININ